MKKFLKNILAFIVFFIIVYFAALFCLSQVTIKKMNLLAKQPDNTFFRLYDISKIDSLDILFIGSSHSYMSFNTYVFDSLGYNTFNMGTISQRAVQSKFIYDNYLKRINIKLIIMEVNPLTIRIDDTESIINLVNSSPPSIDYLRMSSNSMNPILINTTLLRCSEHLIGKSVKEPNNRQNYYKGFSGANGNNKTLNHKNIILDKHIIKEQLNALTELVNLWKNKNQKYILIQAPVTSNHYKSWLYSRQTDSIFNSLGSYINYNGVLKLNDTTNFTDYQHLNTKGSKILSFRIYKDFLKN